MANDSDEEHLEDEQQNENILGDKERKIFFNHVDSFHGKNIARVSGKTIVVDFCLFQLKRFSHEWNQV